MRNGVLRVLHPVAPMARSQTAEHPPFLLVVEDDDGSFGVIGSQWVRERWAGAAPVEPATPEQFEGIERMMLREADRRRHQGGFDADHPMRLEHSPENIAKK